MSTSSYHWQALLICGVRPWLPDPAYPWHGLTAAAEPRVIPWPSRQRTQFDCAAQMLGLLVQIEPDADGQWQLIEQRTGRAQRLPAMVDGQSKRLWWEALCALAQQH